MRSPACDRILVENSLMHDESMDDRAEKLRTEIGLSPLRSLRDSLNLAREKGEKREMDIQLALIRSSAIFVLHPFSDNFYFLTISSPSFYFPQWMTFSFILFLYVFAVFCFSYFQWNSGCVYLKCIFNKY